MPDVVRYDHIGTTGERRGDDVPVPDIDFLRDSSDESFRPLRHGLGKCCLHPFASPLEPLDMIRLPFDQAPNELIEDLAAPRRAIEAALGKPQQQVADDPRV